MAHPADPPAKLIYLERLSNRRHAVLLRVKVCGGIGCHVITEPDRVLIGSGKQDFNKEPGSGNCESSCSKLQRNQPAPKNRLPAETPGGVRRKILQTHPVE